MSHLTIYPEDRPAQPTSQIDSPGTRRERVRAVVTDIEGMTSSVAFVREVLKLSAAAGRVLR
ncbi:hypothetical protein WMF37_50545 [Sorangium sp. So ce291]|uniref:hypothetical protein n=1 Tax=Sorangium sp. So ce291 TaxID=3133294 RepID=UPI003F5E3231